MFMKLSKRDLFEVMRNMVYVYSSAWFKSEWIASKEVGLEIFLSQDFIKLFREFGEKEARILVERSIVSGRDADSIIKALSLSHWALFEKIELKKISDNKVRMRTIDCTRQKYAIKKWGTEYPCKNLGFSKESRTGFVKVINPSAEVKCIFAHQTPDQKMFQKTYHANG